MIDEVKLARYIKFEGKPDHFYLDGRKNVTIGIGCLISAPTAAAKLYFKHRTTSEDASFSEVLAEYQKVAESMPNQSLSYYKDLTKLYIENDDIMTLFEFRLVNLRTGLQRQLPYFITLAASIQDVVEDMGFNLGVTGLVSKFPKFCIALQNKDYTLAATECWRNNISEERNNWTRDTLLGSSHV